MGGQPARRPGYCRDMKANSSAKAGVFAELGNEQVMAQINTQSDMVNELIGAVQNTIIYLIR